MRRLVLVVALAATLPALATVTPAPAAPAIDLARFAHAAVTVPPEWDGVYTTLDSMYSCAGALQSVSTGSDTLCGGKDYGSGGMNMQCTGTADATSFTETCTGSEEIFPDCFANYTLVSHGTRTAEGYHIVATIQATYSGTGTGCDLFPPSCSQMDSWGTRTGPAPTDYCLTPTRSSTWGGLKIRYR